MESESILHLQNNIDSNTVKAEITDIQWERIIVKLYTTLTYSANIKPFPVDFYMVNRFYKANVKMDCVKIDDNHVILTVNVTNPGYCRCIPGGTYAVFGVNGDEIVTKLECTLDFAPNINAASRYFLHNGASVGYCVNFSLQETDEGLYPEIKIFDSKRASLFVLNKDRVIEEDESTASVSKNRYSKKFERFKKSFFKKAIKGYYKIRSFCHFMKRDIFPGSKKTILFMSEQNEKLGANLEAVYTRMIQRGLDKEFKILQSFRAIVAFPENYGLLSWFSTISKMASSDFIFVDDHCPMLDWMHLNTKVILSQLWHAGAGYKGVGYSRWGHNGCPAPFSCHRQYTYSITPSSNIAFFFSEQFGINDYQILSTGMPRMDQYLDKEYQSRKIIELKNEFPLINGKKVILFAPTYRGNNRKTAYYPYDLIDFKSLYDFCSDEYVVLFKMHPWVAQEVPIDDCYSDKFLDVGKYPNINDLFYITDILISDYSSSVFEYSLMRRPALFFAYDELQYSYTRGFHRDYRSSTPGKICNSFDELMNSLKNKDFEYYKMEDYIKYHFEFLDSGSSDRVIDYIVYNNLPEYNKKAKENTEAMVRSLLALDFINAAGKAQDEDDSLSD